MTVTRATLDANATSAEPISRASRRGAILVEAIVVISFFILVLLGVGYFRSLYVQKLQIQRLARTLALTHAMGACKGDPRTFIGKQAGARNVSAGTVSGVPFDAIPELPALPGAEKGVAALESIREKKGDTGLDAVTTVTLGEDVRVTSKRAPDGPDEGFRSVASSTSYVLCADSIDEDRYEGMAEQIANVF